MKTFVTEPARRIPVRRTTDVLVVGGGPAGLAAAVACARLGVKTLLVERYGFLGGQASEGFVTAMLGFGKAPDHVRGIPLELMTRLHKQGQAVSIARFPTVTVDPEALKLEAIHMLEEAGAELLLHALGVGVTGDLNQVDAVIFESKSGRFAVQAKLVIDCTGDADLAAAAGAPFELREKAGISLVCRMGHVDFNKCNNLYLDQPQLLVDIQKRAAKMGCKMGWCRTINAGEMWVDSFALDRDATNVDHLTEVEVKGRKKTRQLYDFMRKNIYGWENAQLLDTSCLIGTRKSRMILGETYQTHEEFAKRLRYKDCVSHCSVGEIPYGSLIPKGSGNLLVAGRGLNPVWNVIQAMASGHAAGAAAALAVKLQRRPVEVPIRTLQATLRKQDVNLGPYRKIKAEEAKPVVVPAGHW